MRSTKNFKESEFNCKCSQCNGSVAHNMDSRVMVLTQRVRELWGKPLSLSSAYRCANHPIEAKKSKPGTHHLGIAVDITVTSGYMAYQLIKIGLELGATGFAYGNGFVHLDFYHQVERTWKY